MKAENATSQTEACGSCYGTGDRSGEAGVQPCPDCGGTGALPPAQVRIEWRLRDIERKRGTADDELAADVRWLCAELHQARKALLEIVSLSGEEGGAGGLARIGLAAASALGMARPEP